MMMMMMMMMTINISVQGLVTPPSLQRVSSAPAVPLHSAPAVPLRSCGSRTVPARANRGGTFIVPAAAPTTALLLSSPNNKNDGGSTGSGEDLTAASQGGSLKRRVGRPGGSGNGNGSTEAPTLYDVLGASPTDTAEQLKRRYTALARTLHPDANGNNRGSSTSVGGYELSEINAAWQVLGTPKERLRYDRSLKAKEFTTGVEALVDLGIATAIPFLQKTARTTVRAVDVSAKAATAALDVSGRAAQEGADRARLAYTVFELEQQGRVLQQRVAADQARAAKLARDLDQLREAQRRSTNHLQGRIDPPPPSGDAPALTFAEAQRLVRSYQPLPSLSSPPTSPPPPTADDVLDALRTAEADHREWTEAVRSADRACTTTDRTVERAEGAERAALRRYEEAQRALEQARADHGSALQARADAEADRSRLKKQQDRSEGSLRKVQEKARIALLRQQGAYLAEQEAAVRREVDRLEADARQCQREALQIRQQIAELERQQQQQ
jgi:curved DNA-binding protein CbpA